MRSQLEKYFGCEVKVTKYTDETTLPIFMAMRDIHMVSIYDVNFVIINITKESDLTISAMKKQKKQYEEELKCPVVYDLIVENISMRSALIKNGIFFIDLPNNVFIPFLGVILQDKYRKKQFYSQLHLSEMITDILTFQRPIIMSI